MRLLFFTLLLSSSVMAQHYYLFVGTYTNNNGSKGIYVYDFDAATGKASPVSSTENVVNPSFLTIAPGGKYVYAVNETNGNRPGQVSAFSFDAAKGQLTYINQQPSGGDDPCYVSVTKDGKWVFVANYSGGSLSALPVNKDGSLKPYAQLIQHTGHGINKSRQEKPHVHSVVLSPQQDYLLSADLGLDKIFVYKINKAATQPLSPATIPEVHTPPGSGPRHLAFHPNHQYVYLMEEMGGYVDAYSYSNGNLNLLQRIAAHPEDYKGDIGSADIHLTPDGRFLYGTNRGGENTITIYTVQPDGTLKLQGFQSTKGVNPRNFTVDPSGNYLLVANQNTNNIVVFKINKQTGALTATGEEIKVPSPVYVQMLER